MELMEFPERFEEFIRRNSFNAKYAEVCGDDSPVISVSDVKQGIEHYFLNNEALAYEELYLEAKEKISLLEDKIKWLENIRAGDEGQIEYQKREIEILKTKIDTMQYVIEEIFGKKEN